MSILARKLLIGITPYLDDGIQHIPKGYLKGIEGIGGEPLMIRHETPAEELEGIVSRLDGMLFSGGLDVNPERYGAAKTPQCGEINDPRDKLEIPLVHECIKQQIPILGICRGCQIINVALGGTLIQDIPTTFGVVHQMKREDSPFEHRISVAPNTMLYDIMRGDIMVNSYHHQCVDRLADTLIPSAYSPENIIEAYERSSDESFLMAVQWHPEVTLDVDLCSRLLFERFRQAILAQKIKEAI